MPTIAEQLYKAGRLEEAIEALNQELRKNPTDRHQRTFLFELLCFTGQFDRAEKQLELVIEGDQKRQMGALLYKAAIAGERTRLELFEKGLAEDGAGATTANGSSGPMVAGTWNGKPFSSIEDADPRIGPRLEVLAGGNYVWIPVHHVNSVTMEAPKRLRDLLWIPAVIRTARGFKGADLGEVLLPVLSPFSFKHADPDVRLGRKTVYQDEGGLEVPYGQKMMLVDNEEVPLLELRSLEIQQAE